VQLLPSKIDIEFLRIALPDVRFALLQSSDTERFISCFIARFEDNDSCAAYWKKITSEIAVNFQESLSSNFASWNIYLALVTPLPLEKYLKYKIENDRFALRKIVLSVSDCSSNAVSSILSELEDSILGKDLQLFPEIEAANYEPGESNVIWDYLASIPPIPLDGKDKSAHVRKQRINDLLEHFSQS